MDDKKMVHQANQIAAYFEVYAEERARQGVFDHIRKFWPPRMRAQLIDYARDGGAGLHPLVLWSVAQLADAPGGAVASS